MTQNALSKEIKSIVLGPGSGEYIYELKPIYDGDDAVNIHKTGKNPVFDALQNKTDMAKTLEMLKTDYPNLKNVSVIVGWFGDTIDAGKISIRPATESKKGPAWKVGEFTRSNAYEISKDEGGNPNWGGTPTDQSILDLTKALDAAGYNVTIYPMLFMDDEGKSGRGLVDGKKDSDIKHFFEEYGKFVKHYASLEIKGEKLSKYMGDIIIGSELEGLTNYKNSKGIHTSVDELVKLAGEVRSIVGQDVKITYAANWTEYHHASDGYHPLDKLWADKNIDYVGIDAYFKLTDGLQEKDITIEKISKGWESGVDFDYEKDGNKKVKLSPDDAIKNIQHWWTHQHKDPNGKVTEWAPKMKPIVFTEVGFTSRDATANDPSSYYDPESIMGSTPDGSQNKIDYEAQFKAIVGTENYWNKLHETHPELQELAMRRDYYKIDARYGYEKYSDGDSYHYAYSHDLKITEMNPDKALVSSIETHDLSNS